MSVAEAREPALFGQITLEDMRKNGLLTRTVMPLVSRACAHTKGRFTADSVADGLVNGEFKLWGVMIPPASLEGVVVSRKVNKVLEILALGPDLDDVVPSLKRMTNVARSEGCARVLMVGPGFLRKRLPEGWKTSAVVYEYALG
jgi:hypothetical protein